MCQDGGVTISSTRDSGVDPGWVRSPTHSSASNGHSSTQMPQYMHSDQSMAKRSSTFRVRSRAPDGRPCHRLGMRVNADAPGRALPGADHAGRAGRFDQPDPPMRGLWRAHVRLRRTLPPTADSATSAGSARAATHRDHPTPQGPGRPEAPTDGGLARHRVSPGSLAPGQFIPVRAASTSSLRSGVPSNSGLSSSRRRSPPTNSTPNSSAASRSCHAAPAKTPLHRVDPRIIAGQRTAQHPRLGPLGQIPYDQNHPQTIPPTDLVDTAEPVEIVETIRLQRLDRSQPVLRRYLGHDATRPATDRAPPTALPAEAGNPARTRRRPAADRCPWSRRTNPSTDHRRMHMPRMRSPSAAARPAARSRRRSPPRLAPADRSPCRR